MRNKTCAAAATTTVFLTFFGSCSVVVAAIPPVSLLPLEILSLKLPTGIDGPSECFSKHVPNEAIEAHVIESSENSTVVELSVERVRPPAYAELVSIRIDSDASMLVIFDAPGSKTLVLPGTKLGAHRIALLALTVVQGGIVSESSHRATCLDFRSM